MASKVLAVAAATVATEEEATAVAATAATEEVALANSDIGSTVFAW